MVAGGTKMLSFSNLSNRCTQLRQIIQCLAMQALVHRHPKLVCDSICHIEPMQLRVKLICLLHSFPPYLHSATSEMWCWSVKEGKYWKNLSLCYSIVYCYNGAQRYEQFLQVGQLYRALILLSLALCFPNASVSLVFMMLYIYIFKKFAKILLVTF